MAINDKYTIDLEAAARSGKPVLIKVENDLFEALDEDEITGGQLDVEASVKSAGGIAYSINYSIDGIVTVPCDRCLDDLSIPVSTSGSIKLYQNEEDSPHDGESKVIRKGAMAYDPSWDIYEIAEVALPLQRAHKEGECNPEMMEILKHHHAENNAEEETEEETN